jgi:hypothetical protein
MEFNFNITNYTLHPTNTMYYVFNFKTQERANFFENLLVEHKLTFEKDVEEIESGHIYLFGIHKKDFQIATRLNNLTIGKFRKPFIPDTFFRYFVLLLGLGAILLGVIGYFVKG